MSNAPKSIRRFVLPRPAQAFPSPGNDWQDEVIYFLLPDRFSDNKENQRSPLDRTHKSAARAGGNWQKWSTSGGDRWQGGTLAGIRSKLPYLSRLGATAIWIGPVFRQRRELNTFHGYAIQNFVEVDPHLGTAQELVDLVKACHDAGLRVILDVVFNHSGNNWVYAGGQDTPNYVPYPQQLGFGAWRDASGQPNLAAPAGPDDGVWPTELQDPDAYMRAGCGSLSGFDSADPNDGTYDFRRTDFIDLRKFNHFSGLTLSDLALCYKYWIGLTDCDGFRIDTMKHMALPVARAFTGAIKEFAASINKTDFFLVAEIAGGDVVERQYLDSIDAHKMNAALDLGSAKQVLRDVARGLVPPCNYFKRFETATDVGESRKVGSRLVSMVDDHDNLSCESKLRFTFTSPRENQIVAALAIQFFTLSIPCIYYGSEQALSYNGPAGDPGYELPYLMGEGWGGNDRFLREAMFGPEHPMVDAATGSGTDATLPGFGPFGTSGFHCFDEANPTFVRLAHLLALRRQRPALRVGRQYMRPLGQFGWDNDAYPGGEIIAWSRILDDLEMLIVINGNGNLSRSADVMVDLNLSPPNSTLTVLANTAHAAAGALYQGTHPIGSKVMVKRVGDGPAFVSITDLEPCEVLVLCRA